MKVSLTIALDEYARGLVKSGCFKSHGDVLRYALEQLMTHTLRQRESLRRLGQGDRHEMRRVEVNAAADSRLDRLMKAAESRKRRTPRRKRADATASRPHRR